MGVASRGAAPRILVLFGSIPLLGMERGNIHALSVLKARGCDVLFLIRDQWTEDTIQADLTARGIAWEAVPFSPRLRRGQSLRMWGQNLFAIGVASWRFLRIHAEFRPTHLHAGGLAGVLNFSPALLLVDTPLVYRLGDLPSTEHPLWRWVWAYTAFRVTHFVCISRFIQDRLVEYGVSREKTTVIYNAPPVRAEGRVVDQNPLPAKAPDQVTFLYVGQLTRAKGLDLLVRAAIAHCDGCQSARFLIAGDYEWQNSFAQDLIEVVARAGHSERIRFLGYVERVPELFDVSDVHVCPSCCEEALGNVVVEAKQAGVPSIVFPRGGLPELVEHEVDGFLCSDSSFEALAVALDYYQNNSAAIESHGVKARSSLKTRLGVPQFQARWFGVYSSVHSVRQRGPLKRSLRALRRVLQRLGSRLPGDVGARLGRGRS